VTRRIIAIPRLYRKKPVEVEARQVGSSSWKDLANWCEGQIIRDNGRYAFILIGTLEGNMRAEPGDWIIRGVHGEFYPCKPDIFEKTYEPVFR